MPRRLSASLPVLLALAHQLQALQLEDCRISNATRTRSEPARCGRLSVPENPADPGGPHIDLFVAVVPALQRVPAPDRLTVLAGGPGAAATEFYVDYAAAFERVRRQREILLLDQRGTGASNPLDCPDAVADLETSPDTLRAAARTCLATFTADLRDYTTSIAVRDLDTVRAALGYPQLNLYGASYGTRVALHYLRRYPERTRSVVLDGVLPADLTLGPQIALDAQRTLDAIFARCGREPACAGRFPDLAARFAALRAQLDTGAPTLRLADPWSGELTEMRFGVTELGGAVRLLSYSTDTASLLPLLIDRAAGGDIAPLAAQALMSARELGAALSEGMHNAVVCTEDVPFFAPDAAQQEATQATYLGALQVEGLQAVCAQWPRGVLDADFKTPVVSDRPALLLSGAEDPVTPPANAQRALATLTNGRHLVAPGQGHGIAALGCMPRLLAQFMEQPDAAALDASCLARLAAAPFFTSFNGPPP